MSATARPRGDRSRRAAFDEILEQRLFAAREMVGAGGVDHEAIGGIGARDRGVAADRPEREPLERIGRDHRVDAAMAKPFLEAREQRRVVRRGDIDDPPGFQPGLRQSGREDIDVARDPEDRAARPRRDAGREKRGGGAIERAVTAAADLMQRPERQVATRFCEAIRGAMADLTP